MLKRIEQPDISTIKDCEAVKRLFSHPSKEVERLVLKSFSPYSHWETIKHWPMPEKVKAIEFWALIKRLRAILPGRRQSVVTNESGSPFTWGFMPSLEELLHEIDMELGGNLFVFGNHIDEQEQHRLLSRGVMEEAIASSQLEGAHTSRKAAKQMILEGRTPKTKGEQMIINNYRAMRLIEDELKDKKLTEEMLMELHKVLTIKTLDVSDVGRYRTDKDEIIVGSNDSRGEIYHIPPKESFLRKEIPRLIKYANDDIRDGGFVHPVIKAVILHFWIGYLHPFTDGNGRMARAIFYWYLMRHKYWAFSYLPLSKVIKNSPVQYGDAYIYSEQDDNDLTYFVDYNVRKIKQALNEFEVYADRKRIENLHMAKLSRGSYNLNDRQIQLLRYFYKNKNVTTSVTTHMKVYEIARMTAIKDLKLLEEKGLVSKKKMGRNVNYWATDKVGKLFS